MRNFSQKALCLLSSAVLLCGASAIPASAAETAEPTTAAISRTLKENALIKEIESANELTSADKLEFANELEFEKALTSNGRRPIVTTTTAPAQEIEIKRTLPGELKPRLTTRRTFLLKTTTTTSTTTTTTTTAAEPACNISYKLNASSVILSSRTPSYTLTASKKADCVIPANAAVKYQWFKDSVSITGATSYQYSVNAAGNYWCKVSVTYSFGSKSVTKSADTYTCKVSEKLEIKTQPKDAHIYSNGASCTLSVTATGGKAPYKYKWTRYGNDISKNTASISVTENGQYRCEVTDSLGNRVTSNIANVYYEYLRFGGQILSGWVYSYSRPLELYATPVGGTAPYRYQWVHDGYIMPNTTATINVTERGSYYLTVFDAKNNKITSKEIKVYQSILRLTTQPKSVSSDDYNNSTTLSVSAAGGTGTTSYEWQKYSNGQWVSVGYRPTLTVYRSDTHEEYTRENDKILHDGHGYYNPIHYYTKYRCVVKSYYSNGNVAAQVTSNIVTVRDEQKSDYLNFQWAFW
ncbi:hypothetical protein [Ruminococcus sp.]|uniref:hypothetical protein n=1 Tax=Ruminococcus sp. TaxID=41978 RepID=UPI0025E3FE9A|nr:hypothetical protein [Ruminococcus sp.]MCR4639402.1 hypothetical protein [Ruminococcus sp.]